MRVKARYKAIFTRSRLIGLFVCHLLLQVHLLEAERAGQAQRLQTEGINFAGLWEQQLLLDVNK